MEIKLHERNRRMEAEVIRIVVPCAPYPSKVCVVKVLHECLQPAAEDGRRVVFVESKKELQNIVRLLRTEQRDSAALYENLRISLMI